jgi:hypothetical protein
MVTYQGKIMRLTFCVLCGQDDPTTLEHHHYIPKVQGGTDDETNMFTLCGTCHGKVHDIPRPLRLSILIKEGNSLAETRSASELRTMAQQKIQHAEELKKEANQISSLERLKRRYNRNKKRYDKNRRKNHRYQEPKITKKEIKEIKEIEMEEPYINKNPLGHRWNRQYYWKENKFYCDKDILGSLIPFPNNLKLFNIQIKDQTIVGPFNSTRARDIIRCYLRYIEAGYTWS